MKFKNRPKQEKVRIITVTVIIFLPNSKLFR